MAKLGDICQKTDTIESGYKGQIEYIDISSVDNQKKEIISTQILEYDTAPSRAKQLIQNGDILISNVRPNLNAVALVNIPEDNTLVASTGYTVIRCNAKAYNRYVFFFCQSLAFIDALVMQATGASYPAVNSGIIKSVTIPLPPLSTQKQIAANLDKATQTIDLCNAILEKLDLLVKARFVEMFGDMSSNPYNWDKVKLGTVCDVRDGTHDSPKYYDVGYPLVTSKNVTSGIISFEDCSLICKEDFLKINERSKVDYGDILMPMIGTVGKPVIVDVDREFAIKNVALLKFNSSTKVINIFVKSLLQSDYFDRVVISKVRGGTQKFIALGDIRKLELYLPPLELQNQFAAFVAQTDKSKIAVKQVLAKAETLKEALMQEYFG